MLFVLEPKHAQLGYVLRVLFVLQTEHTQLGLGYALHVLLVFESIVYKEESSLCNSSIRLRTV